MTTSSVNEQDLKQKSIMKKLFYAAVSFAALAATVSCSKEESTLVPQEEPGDVVMVPATISAESSDSGTRTTASYSEEEGKYKITWEAGDALGVFNDSQSGPSMTRFTADSDGELTDFTGEIPAGSKVTYAILPYDENASLSGTSVLTSIPTEQDGDFGNIVLAGWPKNETKDAVSLDFKYQFEAVCGILKFHFDKSRIAEGKTITSISIIADKPISGAARISYASGKPVMTPNPNATGSNVYNVITVRNDEGLADGDYYIATFPIGASGEDDGMNIFIRFETKDGYASYKTAKLGAKGQAGNWHIFAANTVKNIGNVKVDEYLPPFTSGRFTVNANGGQVTFSRGNLQYQASTGTWRFALNQWDAQGETGNCTSAAGMSDNGARATQSEWIDLFPWGHTGWETDGKTYYPYNGCPKSETYLHPGTIGNDVAGTDGDWGHYCAIVNGDETDEPGTWRLPTLSEFNYIAYSRTENINQVRYQGNEWNYEDKYLLFLKCGIRTGLIGAKGKEIVRYGVMLFPDGFEWPEGFPIPGEGYKNNFVSNSNVSNTQAWTYTLAEFAVFEANGVVFLPNGGETQTNQNDYSVTTHFLNQGVDYDTFNNEGYYWTTSGSTCIAIYIANLLREHGCGSSNQIGRSVRLVQDAQ